MSGEQTEADRQKLMNRPKLMIKVVEARALKADDLGGSSDPFVELRIKKETLSYKTKVLQKTTNPFWNEEFVLHVTNPETDVLEVKVYDSDATSTNDLLGQFEITVAALINKGPHEEWRKLQESKGPSTWVPAPGELKLFIQYVAPGQPQAHPVQPVQSVPQPVYSPQPVPQPVQPVPQPVYAPQPVQPVPQPVQSPQPVYSPQPVQPVPQPVHSVPQPTSAPPAVPQATSAPQPVHEAAEKKDKKDKEEKEKKDKKDKKDKDDKDDKEKKDKDDKEKKDKKDKKDKDDKDDKEKKDKKDKKDDKDDKDKKDKKDKKDDKDDTDKKDKKDKKEKH
jgi:hypothetical protein